MALAFLRNESALIDLRQPLRIIANEVQATVGVSTGLKDDGPWGQIVARLMGKAEAFEYAGKANRSEEVAEKYGERVRETADSLMEALAIATTWGRMEDVESTAWVIHFDPVGDSYWTVQKTTKLTGAGRVDLVRG